MPDDRSREHAREFEAYWDALLAGRPARSGPLDPEVAETARRLQALRGDDALDPSFADRLLEDLMTAHGTTILAPSVPYRPAYRPHANGHARPAPVVPSRRARPRTSTRWLITQAATAALLLVTILFGYVAFRGDHPAAIPAVQGTPETTPAGSWPVPFGGNPAGTRDMPGPGPVSAAGIRWTYPADDQTEPVAVGPFMVAADGALYAGSRAGDVGLVAIDLQTGTELWRSTEAGGRPAVDGDGLIARTNAPTGDGYDLVRVRRSDGGIVWRAEQGRIAGTWAAAVADGVGYVPSGTDVVAFDPATGARRWSAPLEAPASRAPSVGDGIVVLGDERGTVYAIGTDGAPRWTYQTGEHAGAALIANVSIRDGSVFVAVSDDQRGAYLALDAATGNLLWSLPAIQGGRYFGGAIGADTAYVSTTSGLLQAVDLATGQPRWTSTPEGGISNLPSLSGAVLYLGIDSGALAAIDAATGAELWRVPVVGQGDCVPVVIDGAVYVSTSIGDLSAVVELPAGSTPVPAAEPAPSASAAAVDLPALATFAWDSSGGSEPFGQFVGPSAIAPDGNLWVADSSHSRFQIFAPDGTLLETWGGPGTGNGQFDFRRPNSGTDAFGDVAFAPDGSFYVADQGNFRIQHFAADRTFLAAWGSAGTGDGQFLSPTDVEVDPHGNVFVNDDKRADVQKFSADGTFLLKFGGFGNGPGKLNFQGFMDVDDEGNVWVADDRLEVWDNDGRYLAGWTGSGLITAPVDVAVDAAGRVFVADAEGDRYKILVLDRFGNPIGVIAEAGTGDGQFSVAQGLVLDGQGNLYAGDIFGPVTRIQKLTLLPPLAPA